MSPSKISVKIASWPSLLPFLFTGGKQIYGYIFALLAVGLCMWGSRHMQLYFQLPNIVMVYLAVVALVAFLAGRGPSILASVLAALAFDLYNVPPHFLLTHSDGQYLLTLAIMLSIGLLISGLTSQLRDLVEESRQRERETATLYALSRELAATRGVDMLGDVITRHIESAFNAEVKLLLPDEKSGLQSIAGSLASWNAEQAEKVWQYRVATSADKACRPLEGAGGWVGLLMLSPALQRKLSQEASEQLLRTMLSSAALAMERMRYGDAVEAERMKVETERLRNSLLSAVSHDLRTPLATIVGASSSLQDDRERLDAVAVSSLHKVIFQASMRMRSLVENILDMARLQSGDVHLRREWEAVDDLLGASLQEIRPWIGKRQITLNIPPDFPLLRFDFVLMQRVLINLLENAIKYTSEEGRIRVDAKVDGDQVVVVVSDDGLGLPVDEHEKVFEKFYRGRVSSATTAGAGLGLSICRAIVEAHHGKISVADSVLGGGSFAFSLPRDAEPAPTQESTQGESLT